MPKRSPAGFTLLEVVLALTALALLTTICYAAFALGLRAVRSGTAAVVTQQRLRAVMDVMMRQMKSAFPYPMLQDGTAIAFFRCEPGVLSFVTTSGQLSGGTPSWVSYELGGDPPGLRIHETTLFDPEGLLESFRYANPSDGMDEDTVVEAAMIDGFQSMSFACQGLDGEPAGRLNTNDEDGTQQLPLSVTVTFDGLPGFPGVLRHRIPLMAPTFSEDSGMPPEYLSETVEELEDVDDPDGGDGDAVDESDKQMPGDEDAE